MSAVHQREEGAPALPEDPFLSRVFAKRYRVTGFIGRGGMGSVYEAEDTSLSRTVAIKVVGARAGTPNEEMHQRFFREAKACAAISHPNVVTVHDFGMEEDGVYYLVMERLRGRPLHEMLERERPLAPDTAVSMAAQIARGVEKAHESGLVHRDLKPSNVFIVNADGPDWTLKVLDFGVVKLPDEEDGLTKTGTMLGSPKYMSPEQVIGVHVEKRSDIYSLGAILYRLVLGQPPFVGHSDFQLMEAHVRQPARSPKERGAPISEDLDRIIMRCLEKDRHERFDSLGHFLDELQDCKEAGELVQPRSSITSHPILNRASTRPTRSEGSQATPPTPLQIPSGEVLGREPLRGKRTGPADRRPTEGSESARRAWWPWAAVAALVSAALLFFIPNVSSTPEDSAAPPVEEVGPAPNEHRVAPGEAPTPANDRPSVAVLEPAAEPELSSESGPNDSPPTLVATRPARGASTRSARPPETTTEEPVEVEPSEPDPPVADPEPSMQAWPSESRDLRNPWMAQ